MASVVSLLVGYPLWAGEAGVKKITRTCKFVPCIAEMVPVLDEEVRVARRARDMDEAAERQLAARNAPRLEGPTPPPRPTYDELKAKYGPNWGIGNPDKPREMSREQALAALRAEFGDVVDTIPDRPLAGWRHVARCAPDFPHQRDSTDQRQTEVAG